MSCISFLLLTWWSSPRALAFLLHYMPKKAHPTLGSILLLVGGFFIRHYSVSSGFWGQCTSSCLLLCCPGITVAPRRRELPRHPVPHGSLLGAHAHTGEARQIYLSIPPAACTVCSLRPGVHVSACQAFPSGRRQVQCDCAQRCACLAHFTSCRNQVAVVRASSRHGQPYALLVQATHCGRTEPCLLLVQVTRPRIDSEGTPVVEHLAMHVAALEMHLEAELLSSDATEYGSLPKAGTALGAPAPST
jgi:hypothetical protein